MYNSPIIRPNTAKINKERGIRYTFQWLWIKWRVISTDCQLEIDLVPVEHYLDYQRVNVFIVIFIRTIKF
jgi:hypothetical protein